MKTKEKFLSGGVIIMLMFLLSSCAVNRNLYYMSNRWIPADNKYEAQRRVASTRLKSYRDRNSGAYVQQSDYLDYTFNLELGTMRILNKELYVYVYLYENGEFVLDRKINKEIYRNYTYWAQTRGKRQKVIIDVTKLAVYVRVLEGYRVVGRYTF